MSFARGIVSITIFKQLHFYSTDYRSIVIMMLDHRIVVIIVLCFIGIQCLPFGLGKLYIFLKIIVMSHFRKNAL